MSNQDTYITISRNSEGQIQRAELWAGFHFLEEEAVLLDIWHVDSGAHSDYAYGDIEDRFVDSDGMEIVIAARPTPEVLVASWITDPPTEPTKAVDWHSTWETHVQQLIDIARGK